MDKIEIFIKKFKRDSNNEKFLENHFTNGYCYHFAVILAALFGNEDYQSNIMYNPIDNHFATKYNNKLYDITGEIKLTTDWVDWNRYKEFEPLDSERVIKNCIYKIVEEE